MKAMSFSLLCAIFTSVICLPTIAASDDDQFLFSGFAGANITLDGVATITPDGLVDLTNAHERLKGHMFYPTSLHFRKSPNATVQSFSVSFAFGIHPNYRPSHGFAFFIAKSMNFSTAIDLQYFGIFNTDNQGNLSNHIFAIEFDTLLNTELRDIDANHIGIDINNVISNQSHTAGFYDGNNGLFNPLNLTSGEAMLVWIDYSEETAQINVTMSSLYMSKPGRPLISTIHNLSTVITEVAYLGFASGAGHSNTRHYILGWSFGMNRPAPTIDVRKLPKLPPRVGPKPRSKVLEIVLPIATGTFVFSVGLTIFLLVRRNKKYAELREDWETEFGPHRFSYRDLYYSTEGFKGMNLLGVGGFGRVYKGLLPKSKVEIAVKRVSHESKQGMKEFVAEIVSIGRLEHRNIVHLLGYCRRKGELFLVYEYMPNGSLDKYLHSQDDKPTLSWLQRFQIIKGIASGLLYLHEEWEKVVIHRDIKASNILLDNEMNPRLGDFGLARLYDHGHDSQTTTHVVGTIGYLAPELACTRKATPLTDVFSFGIFILEVVCGRRPIRQNAQEKQLMLVDWVLEHWHNGTITDTVDTTLHGDYNASEACLALMLGLLCSHPFKDARPTMRQVMRYLDGDAASPELTPTHMNFEMLAMMQNEGFDPYIMSYPSSMTSHGTVSDISATGR